MLHFCTEQNIKNFFLVLRELKNISNMTNKNQHVPQTVWVEDPEGIKINRYNEAEKIILSTEGDKYSCSQILDGPINRNSADKKETKDLKYVCNACDKPFSGESNLRIHILSVHEGVKYPCNQCDYQATQQSNLTRHIHKHHVIWSILENSETGYQGDLLSYLILRNISKFQINSFTY